MIFDFVFTFYSWLPSLLDEESQLVAMLSKAVARAWGKAKEQKPTPPAQDFTSLIFAF